MSFPIRATTWSEGIGADLINATTGAAFVGTVNVYVTVDNGTQTLGTVGAGVATSKGNGLYTYNPASTETDGLLIKFTFIGTGAVPRTVEVGTITPAQAQSISTSTSSDAITVADLIKAAFRRINVFESTEDPPAEDQADAFLRFRDLMASWQNMRLFIPFIQRTTWTISSAKGTLATPYTVGLGGDVNVLRPTYIHNIRYQDTSVTPTIERGLLPCTDADWEAIPQKDLSTLLPVRVYYNPTYANAFGSLYLWPVPTSTTLQGVMYAPANIASPGSTADTLLLPAGYLRTLRDNLAVELFPEWRENVQIDPALVNIAQTSLDWLKTTNVRPSDLRFDPLLVGGGWYDFYSDTRIVG